MSLFSEISRREYIVLIILLTAGAAALSFVYGRFSKDKEKAVPLFIFLNAALLHFFYIAYTPTYVRQHDVIGFGNNKGEGQAALIEYLMNNRHLPDFDPREKWGFFQPLLHHIIAAVMLKINLLRGMNYGAAAESIQILTFIYSMVFILYGFRIFRLLGLKGAPLYAAEALTAFHPALTLLSGSVNNDMLSHMFFIMAVFYTLKWYKEDRLPDLLLTALCTGLSMMAKLSGVLIAPAAAFLMLCKLYEGREDKHKILKRIKEYALFAIIVFPLGLFFPVRNMLLFKVPPMFMPEVGEDLSGYGIFSRLFDIRTLKPYTCMVKYGDSYDEYNYLLTLIKTSLTGEFDLGAANPYITVFAWILFVSGILLFITVTVLFIMYISARLKEETPVRVFFTVLILTGIIFQAKLMISVKSFSAGNFRYIAWMIVPAAYLTGLGIRDSGKKAAGSIYTESSVFIFSAAAVYYLLGLP